jgi:hypothetical protein
MLRLASGQPDAELHRIARGGLGGGGFEHLGRRLKAADVRVMLRSR